MTNPELLLQIDELQVDFKSKEQWNPVVKDIHLQVFKGKTLAIVGESGSGKTVTSLAALGLLPAGISRIQKGKMILMPEKSELNHLPEKEWLAIRGKRLSMIFQDPMSSLNPSHTCLKQVAEIIEVHEGGSKELIHQRVVDLFKEVQLPDPENIGLRFPHELSGGQKQRVMIAMAIACNPDLLIADEPTTALDVTVQHAILKLLKRLQSKYGMGMIFISHDLDVVAEIADEIAVMYQGELVELAPAQEILTNAKHPYTRGLIACKPPKDYKPRRLLTVSEFLENPEAGNQSAGVKNESALFEENYLEVRNLTCDFVTKRNLWGKPLEYFRAVDHVSFDLKKGETLGLVGESGCGKSTLSRLLLGLIPATSGKVLFQDLNLMDLSASEWMPYRQKMQLIFQDPYSALNPRKSVGQCLMEVLRIHGAKEVKERAFELLDQVGLKPEEFYRYPHAFSGGQRQRINIARALATNPDFLICDESVSALDVSVQAQVLNLLNDLKDKLKLTYIFISHDLSVVHYMSDRIMVMNKGKIEEIGNADDVFHRPKSVYAQELISSIPGRK
jgi:peptide/nickel transport system ATP-binding protein